mgnify:CR=1 FL=1
MKKLISLFALFALVLASCTKETIYTKAYRFKDEQWAQNVKPKFEVDIQDTTQLYDFIFTLRKSNKFIALGSRPVTPLRTKRSTSS